MDESRPDEVTAAQDAIVPSGDLPTPPVSSSRPDRATVKAYQKQARAEGAQYLKEKKECADASESKAFRKKWKQRKKDYKAGLRQADQAEQKARKKGYRAFRRRIHRGRRIRTAVIALLLVACLVFFGLPSAQTLWRIRKNAKYTSSGSEVDIARASAYALADEVYSEGFVLLKNDGGILPLEEKKLNIFGDDAYRTSSGEELSLSDALADQGIVANRELGSYYQKLLAEPENLPGRIKGRISALVSQENRNAWHRPDASVIRSAKDFSSQALFVLSAFPADGETPSLSGSQALKEDSVQRQVLESVCKEFEHVILVIRSGGAVELGFLSGYDTIDAILWVGSPGQHGNAELAAILAGEVNPSGRTTDTWPVSLASDPSALASSLSYYSNMSGQQALSFREGIYVGYRYYETRFGDDEEAYSGQVVYPFGHGLSYTEYTEKLTALSAGDETVTAEITVKNIGDAAGKDVAELYCSAPYDAAHRMEKSAIELVGFAKTGVLNPGEEETVTIVFPKRQLASWSLADGCYLLEAGDYRFTVGKDVHAALLSDESGTVSVEEDLLYQTDEITGADLANRFAFASDGSAVLSRSDWDAVSFAGAEKLIASDELKNAYQAYRKGKTGPVFPAEEPSSAPQQSVSFAELKGLAYDDEKWEAFLDAFKLSEMIRLTANGAYHTEAVSRLGIPASRFSGGTSGITPAFASFSAVPYPPEAVIGATWNAALAGKFGETIAAEASAYGLSGLYAPSAAIRRSAVSGQAGELFSEDPLLCGKMAAAVVSSIQDKQLLAFAKNFPFSDAESGFGKPVFSWLDEQTLRELYLRPFELTVREGGAKGLMVSSAALGVEQCSGSSALLNGILREEWGFDGMVTTDALSAFGINPALAVKNGTDLIFDPGRAASEQALVWESRNDPSVARALQESVHRICYTLVNNIPLK